MNREYLLRNALKLVFEALRWVFFGRTRHGHSRDDNFIRNDCTIQCDFDYYSIHRSCKDEFPGMSVRFFRYDPNVICCAVTVEDLTKDTIEEIQRLIEDSTMISERTFADVAAGRLNSIGLKGN
jgi:hypothetical protein